MAGLNELALLLPYYAQLNNAVVERTYSALGVATPFTYVPNPGFVEVILAAQFAVETSESAPTSYLEISPLDEGGRIIFQANTPSAIPGNAIASVSASVDWTAQLSSVTSWFGIPLPLVALLPGYTLQVDIKPHTEGNVITNYSLYLLKIPTGPTEAAPVPLAEPVLA